MMTSASALPKNPQDDEPDWRTVYYELDLDAIGPSWEAQLQAVSAFQAELSLRESH